MEALGHVIVAMISWNRCRFIYLNTEVTYSYNIIGEEIKIFQLLILIYKMSDYLPGKKWDYYQGKN